MDESSKGRSAFMERLLHRTSRWLVAASIFLTVLLLIAGTFYFPMLSRPTIVGVGLSDLHMVKFSGVTNQTIAGRNQYMFDFFLFPNAFSWSCPTCPNGPQPEGSWDVYLSGVNATGPLWRLDPLRYMTGAVDFITENAFSPWHNCIPPDTAPRCEYNPFFEVWRQHYATRFQLVPARLNLILYLLALSAALLLLLHEINIAYRPDRMKCRCHKSVAWLCPYPKGDVSEIETLSDSFWDGVRLWDLGRVFTAFVAVAFYETAASMLFVRSLKQVDRDIPEGLSMNPHLGVAFHSMLWSCVGATFLAWLCIWGKRQITRSNDWAEENALGKIALRSDDQVGLLGEHSDASEGEPAEAYHDYQDEHEDDTH